MATRFQDGATEYDLSLGNAVLQLNSAATLEIVDLNAAGSAAAGSKIVADTVTLKFTILLQQVFTFATDFIEMTVPAQNIDYKDFADATPKHAPGAAGSSKRNVDVNLQWKAFLAADSFTTTSKAKFTDAIYSSWDPRIFNLYFSGRVETGLQPTAL